MPHMNRGKTNPKTLKGVDRVVEQLNQKIARMLGKNGGHKQPSPKKTTNFTFSIVIFCCSLILWITTGFYYLNENQFGLILKRGEIASIQKGIKVGFTAPYPFGDIEVLSSDVSQFIDFSNLSQTIPIVLSRDLGMIKVDGKFNYQIQDPSLLFENILQKQNNMDTYVSILVQNELRNYFSKKLESDILKENLTIVAGEVKDNVNQKISAYGIKIIKLNISSLQDYQVKSKAIVVANATESIPLVDRLLQSATEYHQNTISETKAQIAEFRELLPEYHQHPESVVERLYFETKNAIPSNYSYPLLNMNLEELIMLDKPLPDRVAPVSTRERHFDRSVNRTRRTSIVDDYSVEQSSGEQK